jgi:sporulation protein YlmC with PRC-barrel domain
MKWQKQIIIISVASNLAISALAQDTFNPKVNEAGSIPDGIMREQRADQTNDPMKASDIIGMTVQNYQHEKLGKVQDFAVDMESGRIVEVILSTGGFLRLGSTFTAVPPQVLYHDVGRKILYLNASQEKFNAAPRFDFTKWNEETQSNQVAVIYDYYGDQSSFVADRSGRWTNKLEGKITTHFSLNMDGTINTSGARMADTAHNIEESSNAILTRIPDGTWTEGNSWKENATNSWWSDLSYIENTSRLIGTPVKNLQDEKTGKIENFMVNLSSGRIVAVIISSGGHAGIGGELRVVPPTALRFSLEHDTVEFDESNGTLASSSSKTN